MFNAFASPAPFGGGGMQTSSGSTSKPLFGKEEPKTESKKDEEEEDGEEEEGEMAEPES
jgi:hypothetical protein